jgi:vitamin B12 transporter
MKKLFLLLISFLAMKSMADTGDTTHLETVTVTSSKLEAKEGETAKIVQVIDQAVLKRSGMKDLGQILMEETGMIVNGAMSNPGLNKNLYTQGSSTEFTLILIDGVPMNDPSLLAGNFDLRLLPVNQIEKIEILTGSQSVLYGSDAIGGVINIITKEGVEDFDADLRLAYGNLNTLKASLGVRQSLTDQWDYVLDMQSYLTDGVSEAAQPDSITEPYGKDGLEQYSGQLKLRWHNEAWEIEPFLRIVDHRGDYDNGSWQDADNKFTSALSSLGVHMRYRGSLWDWNTSYARTTSKRSFFYNDWTGTPTRDDFDGRSDNLDSYLGRNWNNRSRIIFGTLFQEMRMRAEGTQESDPDYRQISPYMSYYSPLGPNFFMNIGARFTWHSSFGENFSHDASFGWSNNRIKSYVSHSSGFKAPTLSQLYGQWGANPDLLPQISQHLEFGGIWWVNSALRSDLKIFRRNVSQLIVYDGALGFINAHEQKDQGLEFSLNWNPNSVFQLQAIYAFVDGHTQLESNEELNGLIRRPKHRWNLNFTGSYPRTTLRLAACWNAERTDLFFNPISFESETVILEPYFLINFYGEYVLRENRWNVFLDIKNLTGSSFMEIYGYSNLPLTFMLGTSVQF